MKNVWCCCCSVCILCQDLWLGKRICRPLQYLVSVLSIFKCCWTLKQLLWMKTTCPSFSRWWWRCRAIWARWSRRSRSCGLRFAGSARRTSGWGTSWPGHSRNCRRANRALPSWRRRRSTWSSWTSWKSTTRTCLHLWVIRLLLSLHFDTWAGILYWKGVAIYWIIQLFFLHHSKILLSP